MARVLFPKKITHRPLLLLSITTCLVIGIYLLLQSKAAVGPAIKLEAESGEQSGLAMPLQFDHGDTEGVTLHSSGATKVIFDTDMGNDIDDAMALAQLHAYAKQGRVELLAVVSSIPSMWAAPYIDAVNTFYGRGDIPIGTVRDSGVPNNDGYPGQIASMMTDGSYTYPHDLLDGNDGPDATTVLRQTLAAQPDDSVVYISVGFSTNLARLLQSSPDSHSPLSGSELVGKKVRLLANMAGSFTSQTGEFNITSDIGSAQYVYEHWPGTIVSSGFEIGSAIIFPGSAFAERITYTAKHPVWEGFVIYNHANRETWDLTSVIDAIEPGTYFTRSAPGTITVNAQGHTNFQATDSGRHYYIVRDGLDTEKIKNHMIDLVTAAP